MPESTQSEARTEPGAASELCVELAWIENGEGHVAEWRLPAAATRVTYADALAHPMIRELLARLGWSKYAWSVFGKRCAPSAQVTQGDRIELLPGLRVEPNTARQRKV